LAAPSITVPDTRPWLNPLKFKPIIAKKDRKRSFLIIRIFII